MDIGPRTIRFTLNGTRVSANVMPHETLVETLQSHFDLLGARESCAQGLCGCCTVLIDDLAVSACLYLAVFVDEANVVTIEHLDASRQLSPVQEAFMEAGAVQCGFCTPGFVLMVTKMLDEIADPSEDDIRHYLSGNLCRCAAYPEIFRAVKIAARNIRAKGQHADRDADRRGNTGRGERMKGA